MEIVLLVYKASGYYGEKETLVSQGEYFAQ